MFTFKDVGELGELMPGTSSELETEIDPFRTVFPSDEDDLETIAEWRPRLLIELLDVRKNILLLSDTAYCLVSISDSICISGTHTAAKVPQSVRRAVQV
jgi:hypothetical protein